MIPLLFGELRPPSLKEVARSSCGKKGMSPR